MGSIVFSIPSSYHAVRTAARKIRALCDDHLSDDESALMELCVVEALNNIVEHGYREAETGRIDIHVDVTTDTTQIVLTDFGGAVPDHVYAGAGRAAPALDALEDLPEGGFGIALIRQNMDDVEYQRCGERNRLVLRKVHACA